MALSKLYVRLGSHSEKEYLLKTAKLFSGTLVAANLVESTPGATVSLAWKLMGGLGLEFAIDPITYIFGLDLSYIMSETIDRTASRQGVTKIGLKKSFSNLAKQLGGIIEQAVLVEGRSISAQDLLDVENCKLLCKNVLTYQQTRMRRFCETDPQLSEVADACRNPSFVFSPYFFIPDETVESSAAWCEVTGRIVEEFGSLPSEVPKYGVVVVSRRMLKDSNRMVSLMRRVASSGCDGCWFWISNLREESITQAELATLLSVLKVFRDFRKPLFNLHGGFLSALLEKHGLTGFSHGIGYGESKDVMPVVGAAVPTVTYYYPPLHVRVPVPDIERSLSALSIFNAADFHRKVCDCTICVGILKNDLRNLRQFGDFVLKIGNKRESQTPDSAKRCRFHFLLARRKELDYVESNTITQLRADLSATRIVYEGLPTFIPIRGRAIHLETWTAKI